MVDADPGRRRLAARVLSRSAVPPTLEIIDAAVVDWTRTVAPTPKTGTILGPF